MEIYCLEDFKIEFERLISKRSYRILEGEIISYFFNKTPQELSSGTRLNNSDITPYIKKRLGGSGGYRVYFLLIQKNKRLYLMFVHPKTGSLGYENIKDASKSLLYKRVLACIKSGDLYKLKLDESKKTILFKKMQAVKS